jgi:hypothetical protein
VGTSLGLPVWACVAYMVLTIFPAGGVPVFEVADGRWDFAERVCPVDHGRSGR